MCDKNDFVSFAVRRGAPAAAQLHLDHILTALAADRPHRAVPLSEILFHCMREHPSDVFMINGASGESFTTEQFLRSAVRVARALLRRFPLPSSAAPRDVTLLCMMRNTEHLLALYYGALFAAVRVFLLDPMSTPHELLHFLPLVTPVLVVCDADRRDDVTGAVQRWGQLAPDEIFTPGQLQDLAARESDDLDTFQVAPVAADACGVLLPTSGSTGPPKAAEISLDALTAHLPMLWVHHSTFPRPEQRAMFLSTAQWMTFTNLATSCPVYRVTMIISPDKSIPNVLSMLETFKPTWILLSPGAAAALAAAEDACLASLRTVVVTGAPPGEGTLRRLQERAPRAHVTNGYGMTEASGFVALPGPHTPAGSMGSVFNIFDYKLVDDEGKEVKPGEKGELCIKGDWIIQRYVKNEAAYQEGSLAGGWWRTGDLCEEGHEGELIFHQRKKFWFKYMNYQISPEELEAVVCSVPGVREAVVGGTERGAAAAVVLEPGACAATTRERILSAINSHFIEYKRLHGGVAFVTSLPRTHSGKLHRAHCTQLLQRLVASGECC